MKCNEMKPCLFVGGQAPRNGLSLVCFRHVGWSNEQNHQLMETLNDSGRLMIVQTKLEDVEILRFCVGCVACASLCCVRRWKWWWWQWWCVAAAGGGGTTPAGTTAAETTAAPAAAAAATRCALLTQRQRNRHRPGHRSQPSKMWTLQPQRFSLRQPSSGQRSDSAVEVYAIASAIALATLIASNG
jgi:hypothetical protein